MLPAFRDKEAARLRDPEIEDKETRPPPRYKEGTLIEAMQNAWRFVEDEALRDRLKEAKRIGTPATRAEIIGGLKKQGFLTAQGQNIVPTDRGLALFGVLERADPALVDPGVTAELECLLDDVVTGKQEMMGAIDAVCDAARRVIGRLEDGAVAGEAIELGMALSRENGGEQPPTAAMKKFAVSIARREGIKPPAGYTKSGAICRAFLDLHAPERTAQDADRKGVAPSGFNELTPGGAEPEAASIQCHGRLPVAVIRHDQCEVRSRHGVEQLLLVARKARPDLTQIPDRVDVGDDRVMARALEPLVVEAAVPSLADHRRRRHRGVVTLTAIWPACGRRRRRLCNGRHLPPLSHRVAAELAECSAGDQMALDVEEVVDGRMDGEEPLRGRGRFEPLHLSLSSSHRLM